MLLGKIEIVFAEGFGLQAGVDITFKRQNRLAGILRRCLLYTSDAADE